ncbi:glycosyltransferase family 4 protein [Paraburkholderia sp. MM5384-R2]|uniref:glycosyltransferase family 4 protein n=1 Tax=Paraburkholderia sp. MM5384-R2 TaxID=2723097 RepID=UPI0016203E16|nr:glycosyltransferase family 4 protein [Paraburkholderia sp. MM5384-R2]MBB5498006.1 glycosyltransferase involved in cell wall biosynthesis [Paraburkholderia sp. MM5384-R2]
MSSTFDSLQTFVSEPYLGLSRWLTVRTLDRKAKRRAPAASFDAGAGALLYVAASALPYHTSGYTTRTHEIIRAMASAGGRVHAMTRPGYPFDRIDRLRDALSEETQVDEVRYLHAAGPANNRPVLLYAMQAARVVAQWAKQHRVSVIHAASNHVNALPALLAARQLGIPFQYEMRGLWELTRISRTPHYEGRQSFQQGLELEGLVARHADRVFVISEQLGRFARARWGIDKERMFLLPNCVEPERFVSPASREIVHDTIGYAGSLMAYEGLDTLIDAVAQLRARRVRISVSLIGDGEARLSLESQVQRLGLSEQIRFLGRMAPQKAQEALSRCALVCIPRKPFKVCEIVPPIKLVEAMALGKPVIVPDLPVFRDEMGDRPAGWFFNAGDATDLARVIEAAISDRAALAALGEQAKEYATTQRCWRDFVIKALPKSTG